MIKQRNSVILRRLSVLMYITMSAKMEPLRVGACCVAGTVSRRNSGENEPLRETHMDVALFLGIS